MRSIALSIRNHRENILKLSKKEVANKLCISESAVNRWETGAAIPSQKNLIKLSKLSGVTLDELINGNLVDLEPKPIRILFYDNINNFFKKTDSFFIFVSKELVPFKKEILANIIAFKVTSDAMAPVITKNAVVLVDTLNAEIKDEGGVYVFQQGDKTRVKTLTFELGCYVLKSTNPVYSDEKIAYEDFEKSTKIIGKILCSVNQL